MKHDDILWLAGLLEGEGCFSLTNLKAIRGLGTPKVSLNMSDLDVVEKANELMGAKTIHTKLPRKSHWSTTYEINIYGKPALRIMADILPYMGKRRSARIMDIIDHMADKPEDNRLGENNPQSKLTRADIQEILRLVKTGKVQKQVIAKMFRITPSAVSYHLKIAS